MDRESAIGSDRAVLSFCLQNGWCFREAESLLPAANKKVAYISNAVDWSRLARRIGRAEE
jgi:hypothetical protein